MKALAIDTSNLVMGIAVLDGEKVIGEYITNLKKSFCSGDAGDS